MSGCLLGDERLSLEGDSAARGCISKGGRRLLLGELPLRGANRWRERRAYLFLVELSLHGAAGYKERQGCLWTGGSTARGCMLGGGRRLHLGELRPHMAVWL